MWLYKNSQNLRTVPDQAAQSLFRIGDTVGEYSKKIFPGGVEIEFDASNFNGMIEKTKALIEEGVDTIYEATFKQAGVFVMADILHKTDEGWHTVSLRLKFVPNGKWMASRKPGNAALLLEEIRSGTQATSPHYGKAVLIKTLMTDYHLSKASVYRYLSASEDAGTEPGK